MGIPIWKRFMRTIEEKAHEESRLQCNCMVLNDVVDQRTFGEPLASVLADRDPKTELEEQTKSR